MWEKIHSKFYKDVSAQEVWEIWTDIENWPKWHNDLEYCKLNGNFVVGNSFVLKPKKAPPVKITLTEINENKKFTDRTDFLGAKMFDTHIIDEKENGILLTNKLIVTGTLKWLWIKVVANHVANSVPEEMNALVKLAQSNVKIS